MLSITRRIVDSGFKTANDKVIRVYGTKISAEKCQNKPNQITIYYELIVYKTYFTTVLKLVTKRETSWG